mmetsp:Transcript_118873/g.236855  ORF Transcript_118873/g.236855 Transcript_118873/m.236855 type:complete len:263 (+) Transcript_118873:616-1404(+)
MLSGHDEQFTHHAAALPNVLLNKFATRNTDEATVGVMGDCSCEQSLSSPRGSVKQHTLRLCNAQGLKDLRMLDRQFNHFFNLFDLFINTSDHLIGAVRRFFHAHQLHKWVHLARQNFVKNIAVAAQSNACIRLAVFNVNVFVNVHHIFALLANLYQHFVFPHGFDNFAAVGGRFQKHVQFFTEETYTAIQLVPLCFQTALVHLALPDEGLDVTYVRIIITLDPCPCFCVAISFGVDSHCSRHCVFVPVLWADESRVRQNLAN